MASGGIAADGAHGAAQRGLARRGTQPERRGRAGARIRARRAGSARCPGRPDRRRRQRGPGQRRRLRHQGLEDAKQLRLKFESQFDEWKKEAIAVLKEHYPREYAWQLEFDDWRGMINELTHIYKEKKM